MTVDLPGFADPVGGAQECFRAVLDAMARPGAIRAAACPPPAKLHAATAAVLLTLVDSETSLWIDPALAAATDWVRFHCGPREVEASQADFVLAASLPALDRLRAGTDEGPDESATVILQVADFAAGQRLRLAGPGLRAPATLDVDGLPTGFLAAWEANHALFPRGVDLILCARDRLACLPRSVRIEKG